MVQAALEPRLIQMTLFVCRRFWSSSSEMGWSRQLLHYTYTLMVSSAIPSLEPGTPQTRREEQCWAGTSFRGVMPRGPTEAWSRYKSKKTECTPVLCSLPGELSACYDKDVTACNQVCEFSRSPATVQGAVPMVVNSGPWLWLQEKRASVSQLRTTRNQRCR